MKANRFWIEIVALGAIACTLGLLIATLGAAAVAVAGHQESAQPAASATSSSPTALPIPARRHGYYEGMVTCSRCGAKHSAEMAKTADDCARECVRGGATFALVNGDRTYALEGNLNALKKVAGQRARVVGDIRGNTIRVAAVAGAS